MNSCDFSLGNYACCQEESPQLEGFSIERDKQYILPFIKYCQRWGDITFLMSPWSPPAWMKDNGEMNHGGALLPEYRALWAEYYIRFLRLYQKEGEFVRDYLGPALEKSQFHDVKVLVWDHNKERAFEHVKEVFADKEASKYIWGTAFHWYSGDHFEALDLIRKNWPDKSLMMTECCVLMLLNRRDYDLPVIIRMDGWWKTLEAPAHSLSTVLIE